MTCLFGTARQARAQSVSTEKFAAELGLSCRSEEMALRAAMLRALVQRRQSTTAKMKIDQVMNRSRQAVGEAYERGSDRNDLR